MRRYLFVSLPHKREFYFPILISFELPNGTNDLVVFSFCRLYPAHDAGINCLSLGKDNENNTWFAYFFCLDWMLYLLLQILFDFIYLYRVINSVMKIYKTDLQRALNKKPKLIDIQSNNKDKTKINI